LYAAAPRAGVFKSPDGGNTWQNISAGIFPEVADFCEFKGDLYAATLGSSVFKLNPADRSSWLFFSDGLSNLSVNLPTIASNNSAIITGTLANGIYGRLPVNSTTWEERLLNGQIDPNEGSYDIVTAHDTLFYSGRTGKFYISTNNGLTWSFIGNRLTSAATTMANAKQAVLISRHIFETGIFKTLFYYIKKDSLRDPFVNFSVVPDHFTWKTDIIGNKLWDASNKGLFYMSLSDLPGITDANDTLTHIPLPVNFISFDLECISNKVRLKWKTEDEQNSNRFKVERSQDGIHWTVIGNLQAAGNSSVESNYSFIDEHPLQNSLYRIAEYDMDESIHFSTQRRSTCITSDKFSLWPNPVHDKLFVNIDASKESKATIKLLDPKGALIKIQTAQIIPGSNQLSIDINTLPGGIYVLLIDWYKGQNYKSIQFLKQ